MGNRLSHPPQVNLAHGVVAEQNRQHAVNPGGLQSYRVPGECLADPELPPPVRDQAALLNPADRQAHRVVDRGQSFRKRPQAGAVVGGRDVQLERIVGSLEVVQVAPAVQGRLQVGQVPPLAAASSSRSRVRWKRSSLPSVWGW